MTLLGIYEERLSSALLSLRHCEEYLLYKEKLRTLLSLHLMGMQI